MIPYGKQNISNDDISAVVDVLKSDYLTQGPVVSLFEKTFARYVNAEYSIATNSGTSALHLACLALELGSGDWLWTTPISFVASANCGLYCGASVDFVDIDPLTWNISIESLREKLERAKYEDKLPKIVVAVHLCGLSCDMEEIAELSLKYGFSVIEDACHAVGGRYHEELIGGCKYSDISVFSFHPVKNMTTGEGGMATTNNKLLAEKIALLCSHGIVKDENKMVGFTDGPWYYQQLELGYNYRMTELQAALGISQLSRLDYFIAKRHQIADRYNNQLEGLPLLRPYQSGDVFSALHLYVVRVKAGEHRKIFETLRDKKIGVQLHYIPIHLQPYYKKMGFVEGDFPEAEQYYREAISLPLYPDLTEEEQNRVVSVLLDVLGLYDK